MMSAPIEALTGWFQLGWSDTVPPGELVSVTVLGHGLVARRTLAGNLVVTDAHCPHLGAHLGMGCAVGDGLRCPMHGWEWGEDGSNTRIPYRDDTAASVGLRVFPSRELFGLLFVWIGNAGVAPNHEPLAPGGTFDIELRRDALVGGASSGTTRLGPMTVHPQLAIEDRVDVDHFVGPHGTEPPILNNLTLDGPYFSTHITVEAPNLRDGDKFQSEVLSTVTGLGISCLRIHVPTHAVYIVLSISPIDDRRSLVFHTLWVEPHSNSSASALLEEMLTMMREQLNRDLAIWSRMRLVPIPNDPVAAQPGLAAVRTWAKQFYPNGNVAF